MSYDLFFLKPPTSDSATEFLQYFAARRHFSVQSGQAWYQNEDTGVYFSFELADADGAQPTAWVQFIINYVRPRFFVLEALREVESFVSTFGPRVHDPQIEGMGDGHFDADGFMRGWSAGNESACVALAEQGHPPPASVSTDRLKAAWQWNLSRQERQLEVGESIFVPRIMFVADAPTACTAVVWTDAIPVLLPTVDRIILYRDAYAPKRLFRRKPDVAVLNWDVLADVLLEYQAEVAPVPYRRLDYVSAPASISTFFTQAVATSPAGIIEADSVLESELLERIPQWQAAG